MCSPTERSRSGATAAAGQTGKINAMNGSIVNTAISNLDD
jgi:hypothetical protein